MENNFLLFNVIKMRYSILFLFLFCLYACKSNKKIDDTQVDLDTKKELINEDKIHPSESEQITEIDVNSTKGNSEIDIKNPIKEIEPLEPVKEVEPIVSEEPTPPKDDIKNEVIEDINQPEIGAPPVKDIKDTVIETTPNSPCTFPTSGKVKTFLIAGQSNAGSIGKTDEIPDGYLDDKCVFIYYRNDRGVQILEPGVNTCPGDPCGKAGVEVGLAKELYDTYKEPILIYKYYKGGTALRANEKNLDWSVKSNRELFHRFKTNFLKMKSSQPNVELDIIGMAWIQGEKDASGSTSSGVYFNELKTLVAETRAFTETEFPISIVRLNIQHKTALSKKQGIRKAQTRFVNTDGNAFLVDVDNIPYDPAYVPHYLMSGYIEIGKRIASDYK